MDKQYLILRCATCGFTAIILTDQLKRDDNYMSCMKDGRHRDIRVCGSYDSLVECMDHAKYRRNGHGAVEQD